MLDPKKITPQQLEAALKESSDTIEQSKDLVKALSQSPMLMALFSTWTVSPHSRQTQIMSSFSVGFTVGIILAERAIAEEIANA